MPEIGVAAVAAVAAGVLLGILFATLFVGLQRLTCGGKIKTLMDRHHNQAVEELTAEFWRKIGEKQQELKGIEEELNRSRTSCLNQQTYYEDQCKQGLETLAQERHKSAILQKTLIDYQNAGAACISEKKLCPTAGKRAKK